MSFVTSFGPREPEENYFEWLSEQTQFELWDLIDEIADEREGSRQRILARWWASKNGPGVFSPPSRVRSVPTSKETV